MTDPTPEQRVNDAIIHSETHWREVVGKLKADHLREKALMLATIAQLTLEREGLLVALALEAERKEE